MKAIIVKLTSFMLAVMILFTSMSTTIAYAVEEIEGMGNNVTQASSTAGNQKELDDENQNDTVEGEGVGSKGFAENYEGDNSIDDTASSTGGEDNGNDTSSLSESSEPDNGESSMENARNTRSVTAQNTEVDGSDVPNEIRATTKQDIADLKANNKFKTKNDKYEIRVFADSFVSGASKDSNNNLVWIANNSSAGHEYTFRVNYATSGYGDLPAGSIQITIPKQILRARDGSLADEFTMSLPTLEEYEQEHGTTELVYKEDKDYIIAYNPKEITAAVDGYFEIAYSTNKSTVYYKDYDSSNAGLVTEGGTASDPFYAIISLDTGDETINNITKDINVYIDTTARITSTQKRYPNLYRSWNSSWMPVAPENKDDYYYLVWEIESYVNNPTQMYDFKLEDIVKDLTDGTTGEDYELVGYKLSGESSYSSKNTQTNQTKSGYRYDYVLTRHKKSTYDPSAYRLKNTVKATVNPMDGVDDETSQTSYNIFNWDPSFEPPTGYYDVSKYGNNNWYSRFGYHWDYANYDLDKLQNYEQTGVTELKGFKYYTQTVGYAYPWTVKQGGSATNPDDYGVNSVNYDIWDDTLYLEDDEEPMNTDDYYLEYFTYNISNKDAEYNEFYQKFNQISATYEDGEVIIFYAKFGGVDSWTQIGTYNLKTGALTSNEEYVAEITSSMIRFKDGVHATGWRCTTENKHYYTNIEITPYFVLTNSDYVQEQIRAKDKIKIKNNMSAKVVDYTGNTVFEETDNAFDYARVTYYSSEIRKEISAVSNNRAKRLYTITWRVNAWEKATSSLGEAEYVWQDSGTFYDLIPLGGTVDLDSIQVKNQDGLLDENEYSYEVIDNYNKSGRSMLIIRIKEQSKYYTVYYKTLHTWDSMKDYGRAVLNPVAYETGNDKITYGYPDNGGNLSLVNKLLFSDLDKTTNDKKFIYAEARHTINALTAAASGLDKKVKSEGSSSYTYSAEVEPEGNYSYRIRYQNTYMNKAKDLVWFDSLENFKVVDSSEQTIKTSSWHGTLQSIDIIQLKNKGIDVKLYISTIENLNLEQNNDLTDESVWSLVTDETNLEQAKAIAIDMSKTTSGEDFVLNPTDSVTATLHMKAPGEISEEMEGNPYTYNNIYIKNTLIDSFDSSESYFIHQDYTKVKYYVTANLPLVKVNEQNEDEKIKGTTFRLYGTSRFGTEIDTYVTTDKNGYAVFKNIEAGTYILQEYECSEDWVEDHTEHVVQINNDRSVYVDNQLITESNILKIKNTPRAHTNVVMYKKDLVHKLKFVEGAKFKLEGISDYGTETLMYATSNENGELKFSNLEKGKYELVEIETHKDYIKNSDVYRVIVDENANYNVLIYSEGEYISIYENGKYNLYNEPLHSFTIVKKDAYDGGLLSGAIFKLSGISDYGTTYEKEAKSLTGGLVTFSGLEAGTYILQEIKTPELIDDEGNNITYILDNNKYVVTLKKEGTVTIDGIEKNEYGNFEFYNERNKGQITITKEWIGDEGEEDQRPDPTINISTERPRRKTYAYFRGNYEYCEYGVYFRKKGVLHYVDSDYASKIAGEFKRNTTLTEEEVIALGAKRIDIDYNKPDAEYKIYGWIDESGNFYWWSNAEIALLTDNSNLIFNGLTNVKSIDFTGINTCNVTDMSSMFNDCRKLTSLDLSPLDTSNVTSMSSMFSGCSGLISVDLSSLNASNVTNMSNMFNGCSGLTSLDLSSFDASNVTDMSRMFSGCRGLTSVDLSNFNARNVTNMSYMFYLCDRLTSVDLSSFDTSNVTNMSYMLDGCSGLTSLDLSPLNTSNVTNMSYMFGGCSGLTSIDLSPLKTSNVTDMSYMFSKCTGLTSIDLSNVATSNVTKMSNMFSQCSGLTSIDLSPLDTSNVTNMRYMFSQCTGLTSIDLSPLDTSNVTNMNGLFCECSRLTSIDLSPLKTSNVTDMSYMFSQCTGLTSIDLSNVATSNVTNMSNMFSRCSGLTSIDLSNVATSNVTNMSNMFSQCSGLTSIDLSSFDTSKIKYTFKMFYRCYELQIIYVSETFVITNVSSSNSYEMFNNCSKLVGGNGTSYSSSHTDKTYARIDTPETPGYFTRKPIQSGALNNTLLAVTGLSDDVSVTISQTGYLQTTYMLSGNTDGDEDKITYSTAETNYDSQGNEVHWVKNGNVWTYTFYVDDPYASWYVWEEPVPDGYIANYTIDNPGEVINQQAKVTNYKHYEPPGEEEKITIEYGSLTISKILEDEDGNSISSEEDGTEFAFTVNLTAPAGYEALISGTKVFGNYVFKDGVGIIKLHAGQTASIPGIVVGTTYSVTEKSLGEYESSCNSSSGTISNETENVVTYTNTKKSEEPKNPTDPETPVPEYVDVRLNKIVTGYYENEDEYKFEILLRNLVTYKTYTIEKYDNNTHSSDAQEISYTADNTGTAYVSISLSNGEQIVLKNIPVGATYSVYEYAGNYISSYEIIDANNLNKINNTANSNTKINTSLTTSTETADKGENVTITFTNKKQITQDLKIVKQVTDVNNTNTFMFEIVFSNMSEGTTFNSSVGKITADQDGEAELTIYLAGGEEAEFYGIPVGTKYKVTELASTSIASYILVDSNGLDKIGSVSGANSKPKTALSTELETVNEGEEVTVTFVNDTTSVEEEKVQDSVDVSIGVTKTVINKNNEVVDNCKDTFEFELSTQDESYPMPNNQTGMRAITTINGSGTASFGKITFTEVGTYVYIIREKREETEDYTYDETIYMIIYEVTSTDGLLEVTRAIMKDGFSGDAVVFTNIMNKEPVKENPPEEEPPEDDTTEEKTEETIIDAPVEATINSTKTGDKVMIYVISIIVAGIILGASLVKEKKHSSYYSRH